MPENMTPAQFNELRNQLVTDVRSSPAGAHGVPERLNALSTENLAQMIAYLRPAAPHNDELVHVREAANALLQVRLTERSTKRMTELSESMENLIREIKASSDVVEKARAGFDQVSRRVAGWALLIAAVTFIVNAASCYGTWHPAHL